MVDAVEVAEVDAGGQAGGGAWCVPCGANTGKAETVVVRAVRRKAVVMKAVSKRMDRVKEEGTERAW